MAYAFSVFLKDFVTQKAFKVQSAFDKIQNVVNNTTSRLQRLSSVGGKSLDQLNEKLQLQKAARGATTSVAGIMRLNKAIRETEREIKKLENLPPPSFISRIRQAGSAMGGLLGLAGGLALLTATWTGIKGVAELGMDAEDSKVKFEVLLGSMDKAKTMLADITVFANKTPFESAGLRQNAELMLNFGVASQKIMPMLQMLGDAAGGNQEKLNGMTLAFSQMSATGRLMGQDLNQMINAGFNPLQVISENTGIAMGKLKDQMEAGMISVGMVEEAFKLATGPGGRFNGMMEKTSQTARGRLSTAMDNIKTKLTELGEKYLVPLVGKLAMMADKFFSSLDEMGAILQPFFDTLQPLWDALVGFAQSFFGVSDAADGASAFIDMFKKVLSFLEPILTVIVNGITGLITILTPLAPLIKWIAIIWGGLNLVVMLFNLIITANPIGLIITAIGLLIGIIVTCWQRFATFRGIIMGAWEAIKGFAVMIKNYVINRFKELLSGITGIGQALMYFFKGDFKKAWEAGKNAATNLLGVNSAKGALQDAAKLGKNVKAAYDAEFQKKTTPKIAADAQATKQKVEVTTKPARSKAFDLLGDGDAKKKKDKGGSATSKKTADGIIGGGNKLTNITINLGKMQDQIVINTINSGEGAVKMRQMLEEELLRLLGSVTQMQPS